LTRSIVKLPNFFLVGAAKAGTTSLHAYLRAHPQIYTSPIKEPNYFCKDIDVTRFSSTYLDAIPVDYRGFVDGRMTEEVHFAHVQEWENYLKLFCNVRDEAAIGDCSNTYLYSAVAAAEIKSATEDPRIIIVLRNPIERAFSHYIMDLRIGYVWRPFREELEHDLEDREELWGRSRLYVALGMYSAQVKRYLDVFSRERIKIILSEELRTTRRETLAELYRFLGVEPSFTPPSSTLNEATIPHAVRFNYLLRKSGIKRLITRYLPTAIKERGKKHFYSGKRIPVLSSAERDLLRGIFRVDIGELEKLIERDLSAWLRTA
jgi:Sulfotransferase family